MTTRPIAATLVLGLTLAAAASSGQAAVCNGVFFTFRNTTDLPILVTRVSYRDLNSADPSAVVTENVKDKACPKQTACSTNSQDLGSLAKPRENHDLTDIQFEHSHEDEFGDWKKPVWSGKNVPFDMRCTDGRTYGPYDVQ